MTVVARKLSAKVSGTLPGGNASVSKRLEKQSKKIQDSTGPAWFDMPAPEMTAELEKDAQLLRMRAALDPKQHYRRNEKILTGKYFQLGTIVEDSSGYYNDRLSKKKQAPTVLETLMKDQERERYLKQKFQNLQAKRQQNSKDKYKQRFAKKPWK